MTKEPLPTALDSELAAHWAGQALAEGRYELGAALANIARNAARHEARQAPAPRLVPMVGATRDEQPATPIHDQVIDLATGKPVKRPMVARFLDPDDQHVADGPTGDGDADVPDLGEAPTGVIERVPAQTRRCAAMIEQWSTDGSKTVSECHAVIFWEPGRVGDGETPPIQAGWFHLNPEMDNHHFPDPGKP